MLSRHRFLVGALLAFLLLLAYLPALRGGFIWDDDYYVTENRNLRSIGGLGRIWTEIGAVPQYYPLTHTTFWLEYQLWGLNPGGYHAVNVVLHGLSGLLLYLLLQRLRVPGAWLGAALFLLHPVQVESVAWITERKNVLSGLFFLASLTMLVDFFGLSSLGAGGQGRRRSRWPLYTGALLLYAAALFSKTVTAVLPAVTLVLLWWRGRLQLAPTLALGPFFLLGGAAGLLTAWMEANYVGARGAPWDLSWLERLLVAGRALWFYAGKLAWPYPLIFNYPRWQIDAGAWWQYVFPAAALAVMALLLVCRHRLGRGPLVAALWFIFCLGPALGFVNVYPMRYSFVADHFQYLASIGPLALAGALCCWGASKVKWPSARALPPALLLVLLGALTHNQAKVYTSLDTLWHHTLTHNPNSWMAHHNLGNLLLARGEVEAAIHHYRQVLRLKPDHHKALVALGNALSKQGHYAEAEARYREALRLQPDYATALYNLGLLRERQGNLQEAASWYEKAVQKRPTYVEALNNLAVVLGRLGERQQAVEVLRQVIDLEPDFAPAHYNLALLLQEEGKAEMAVKILAALVASHPQAAEFRNALGVALAGAGRLEEAVAHFEAAVQLRPDFNAAKANLRRAREMLASGGGSTSR